MPSAVQRARDFVRRNNDKARALMIQVRTDAETNGSAFAMGYARGRFTDDEMQFMDVDLELWIGAPMKLVAYMGVLGKAVSPDLHAISNGILSAYAATQGLALGQEHRDEDVATQGGRRARVMGQGNVYPMGGVGRQRAYRRAA